jgi:hypothetical protein
LQVKKKNVFGIPLYRFGLEKPKQLRTSVRFALPKRSPKSIPSPSRRGHCEFQKRFVKVHSHGGRCTSSCRCILNQGEYYLEIHIFNSRPSGCSEVNLKIASADKLENKHFCFWNKHLQRRMCQRLFLQLPFCGNRRMQDGVQWDL